MEQSAWKIEEPVVAASVRRQPREPLGAAVSNQIRDRIVEYQLLPGTSLPSEAALAQEFDVSVRVVRDALRLLTTQGIVETRQGKRAVVGSLRPVAIEQFFKFAVSAATDATRELLDVRLALETLVAAEAARRITPDELAELRGLLDAVRAAGDDLEARAPADVAFHRAIARASKNRFCIGILEALGEVLEDERKRGGKLPASHEETDAQHEALYQALADHDVAGAERAMLAILERARSFFPEPD